MPALSDSVPLFASPEVSRLRRVGGMLRDVALLLLVVYTIPLAIFLIGAPLVLLVWLVVEFVPGL